MKLYTYFRSSSAYRVRIALAVKGIAYEPAFVHLLRGGGEQKLPQFLAKNPQGQVPVLELEHEGQTVYLAQSLAIIEYLEERYPDPPLLPSDLVQRARVRELAEIVNSGIQPFQNTGLTGYLASAAPELDKPAWFQHFIGAGLASLEARARACAGRFLVGDALSLADVLLVPQLYAARRLAVSLADCATLLRVEAACLAESAFASAHPDVQPDHEG